MNAVGQTLPYLTDPDNEPLNWLLGDFLRSQAQVPGPVHFLLRLLASAQKDALRRLNWWIGECRQLMVNPEVFREKVKADLKAGKGDAEIKTKAVLAEVLSVLHLATIGYRNFEAVLPNARSSPDFRAELNGKSASSK
jgi:hypothetical protein